MPVTITYAGSSEELRRAVTQASAMLKSEALLEIIRSRKTPFDDSKPADLAPGKVAEFFRDTNLNLTIETYSTSSDIGGRFRPSEPTVIQANLANLPQRKDCSTAAMLVHECVHALSYHIGKEQHVSFSHTGPRSNNNNTAPYWIQARVRANLCKDSTIEDHNNVQVEVMDAEDVEKRTIAEEVSTM
jgi:hypothetical protein